MKRVLLTLGLAVVAAQAGAQSSAEQRIDSMFGSLNRTPSTGIAISVVRDGKMVFARGYGLASLEHNVPITPTTVFDLASLSKQFTGMAVAMLVDERRISLSDDIRKYIPELSDVGHTITIDHLVHHTSGLRDWPGSLGLAGWRFDDVISFDQILDFAYNQRSLNFQPGAEYMYSNTGYNLLAEMVSRVSGKPFPTVIEERILRPLGMTQTVVLDDHTRVIPNRAYGYTFSPSGYRYVPNALTALGSSSMFSTATDLAKWMINFETAAVGGPKVMALMRTQGKLNDGSNNAYAFGLSHGQYKGLPTISHSGGWASFSTFVMHFPEQHVAIAVLSNNGGLLNAGRLTQQVADVVLEKELASVAAPVTPAGGANAPAVTVAPAVLDRYTGLYRLGPGWYVRIRRDGNTLKTQATREAEFPMTPRSDTTFWVDAYGAPMTFRASRDAVTLAYRGRVVPRLAEGPKPTTSRMRDYVGVFESPELRTAYEVQLAGDTLVMRHSRHPRVVLTNVHRDEFIASSRMQAVEFQRDGKGRVIAMLITVDGRSRDIRFTRRN